MEKEKENKKPKIKRKKLKDTIKISDNQYIKVEKEEKDFKVFVVSIYETLFNDSYMESMVELVPKSEMDYKDLNEKMIETLSKLSDKLENMTLKLDNSSAIISRIDVNEVNKMLNEDYLTGLVNSKVQLYEKEKKYKWLIKTEYFKRAKQLPAFKEAGDLEIAEALVTLDKLYDRNVSTILKDIREKEWRE